MNHNTQIRKKLLSFGMNTAYSADYLRFQSETIILKFGIYTQQIENLGVQ